MLEPNPHAPSVAESLSRVHVIGGRKTPPAEGRTFDVISPVTRRKLAEAAFGTAEDVGRAVASAGTAQKEWAKKSARERGKLVAECGRLLEKHDEELARLVCLETGKAVRTEGRPEAAALADIFNFFGGLGSEIKGQTVPFRPQQLTFTLREPVGVVGAIIPWNVPMMLLALKVCPALVAGNAVVVKAAEEAPFAVLRVAEICAQILPPGVFNLLAGHGPECGAPLARHPDVAKISFTGSVETGRIVNRIAAEKLIPATLELGGKSPMIVMADCDLDKAVEGAVTGMRFSRCGQSCSASSRIFVQAAIHDAFVEKLKARVDNMRMGDPFDQVTDIGTIVSEAQFEKVQNYIRLGEAEEGVTVLRCSALPADPRLAGGLYIQPVLFTGISRDSPLAREEIFGPVACIFKFETLEEALAAANDTRFGLAATLWTKDMKTALAGAHRLEAGFVQVNQNRVVQAGLSYGGYKDSGLGKEATLESMLAHYTREKTVMLNME